VSWSYSDGITPPDIFAVSAVQYVTTRDERNFSIAAIKSSSVCVSFAAGVGADVCCGMATPCGIGCGRECGGPDLRCFRLLVTD
jgi:hypothetical protein